MEWERSREVFRRSSDTQWLSRNGLREGARVGVFQAERKPGLWHSRRDRSVRMAGSSVREGLDSARPRRNEV